MREFQFQVPCGTIAATWNEDGLLKEIRWCRPAAQSAQLSLEIRNLPSHGEELVRQLKRYFHDGEPLEEAQWELIDRSDWSEFQHKVYRAATEIPHGETRTYGWVASRMRCWGAGRAVGQALRKNPLLILVPCHRVVSTASLGGFMGASDPQDEELKLKTALLDLENRYRNPVFPFALLGQAVFS